MPEIIEEYNIALALYDYIPVIFTAVGMSFLIRMALSIGKEHGAVCYYLERLQSLLEGH